MPSIRPVSDLENYSEVLQDVSLNGPVFLTCNGRKRYAMVTMDEYEKARAGLRLMAELARGESSEREKRWHRLENVQSELGV